MKLKKQKGKELHFKDKVWGWPTVVDSLNYNVRGVGLTPRYPHIQHFSGKPVLFRVGSGPKYPGPALPGHIQARPGQCFY